MSKFDKNQLAQDQSPNSQQIEHQIPLEQRTESQVSEKFDVLWKHTAELLTASLVARAIGYGLILMFIIELVNLLIPPSFMNPVWEFQTFGGIVERVAVPLIGMALLFSGGKAERFKIERPLLKSISWLSLIGGILLFLAIPLGVFNTVRIYREGSAQITAQVQQSKTQIKQIQDQLNTVTTKEQMQEFLDRLNNSGRAPEIKDQQQLEQIKNNLNSSLSRSESSLTDQAQATQQSRQLGLFKNSVKWNLGALISGFLFLWTWFLTDWARRYR